MHTARRAALFEMSYWSPLRWEASVQEDRDIASHQGPLRFLDGGGEMGERIRASNWAVPPLGHRTAWPQALKTLVTYCWPPDSPMVLVCGPNASSKSNELSRQWKIAC
jgi:hypothetical protein